MQIQTISTQNPVAVENGIDHYVKTAQSMKSCNFYAERFAGKKEGFNVIMYDFNIKEIGQFSANKNKLRYLLFSLLRSRSFHIKVIHGESLAHHGIDNCTKISQLTHWNLNELLENNIFIVDLSSIRFANNEKHTNSRNKKYCGTSVESNSGMLYTNSDKDYTRNNSNKNLSTKSSSRFPMHARKNGYSREYLPYFHFKPSIPVLGPPKVRERYKRLLKNQKTKSEDSQDLSLQKSEIINVFNVKSVGKSAESTTVNPPNPTFEIKKAPNSDIESKLFNGSSGKLEKSSTKNSVLDMSEQESLESQAKYNVRQSRVFFKGLESDSMSPDSLTSLNGYRISSIHVQKIREKISAEVCDNKERKGNCIPELGISLEDEDDLACFLDGIRNMTEDVINDTMLNEIKKLFAFKMDDNSAKVDQLLGIIHLHTSHKTESETYDEYDEPTKNMLSNYCAAPEKGICWKRLEGIFGFYFENTPMEEMVSIYKSSLKNFIVFDSISVDESGINSLNGADILSGIEPDLVFNLFLMKLLQLTDTASAEVCSKLNQLELLPLKIILTNKRWRFSSPSYDLSRSYGSKYSKMAKRMSSFCSLATVVSPHSDKSFVSQESLEPLELVDIQDRSDSDISNKFLFDEEEEINFYDLYMKFLYSKTNDVGAIIRNAFKDLERNKAIQKDNNFKTMKYNLLTNIINSTLRELAAENDNTIQIKDIMTEYDKSIARLKAKVVEDVACDLYNVYMTYLSIDELDIEDSGEHASLCLSNGGAESTNATVYLKEKKPFPGSSHPQLKGSKSERKQQSLKPDTTLEQEFSDTYADACSLDDNTSDSTSISKLPKSATFKRMKLSRSSDKDKHKDKYPINDGIAYHESLDYFSFHSFKDLEFEFINDYEIEKLESEANKKKKPPSSKEENKHEILIKQNLKSSSSSFIKPKTHHHSFDDLSVADYSVPNEFIFDIDRVLSSQAMSFSKASAASFKSGRISSTATLNFETKRRTSTAEKQTYYMSLSMILDIVDEIVNLNATNEFMEEGKLDEKGLKEHMENRNKVSPGLDDEMLEQLMNKPLLKNSSIDHQSRRRSILVNSGISNRESVAKNIRESVRLSLKTEILSKSSAMNDDSSGSDKDSNKSIIVPDLAALGTQSERRSLVIKIANSNDSPAQLSDQLGSGQSGASYEGMTPLFQIIQRNTADDKEKESSDQNLKISK